MPLGSIVHNLSITPYKKGQYIRLAGTFGQIIQKTDKFVRIKLPSGETTARFFKLLRNIRNGIQ